MTSIVKVIRNSWAFNLIPETENCEGWNAYDINCLLEKLNSEWDKYGCLASNLPKNVFRRYYSIHKKAIDTAIAGGWSMDSDPN